LAGSCKYEAERPVWSDVERIVLPHYDQVYTISHFWGDNVFHGMIEDWPRIALHHDWLMAHPKVKIHTRGGFSTKMMVFLGYPEDRLITGNVVATHVYHPTPLLWCGYILLPQAWVLRDLIHQRLFSLFPSLPAERNATHKTIIVIMIQRRGSRVLQGYNELRQTLTDNYRVDIWDMTPDVPPVEDLLRRFYLADLIIAPHGAGLSNMIASRPGTVVLEFLTNRDINYCYAMVSRALLMQYHGVLSSLDSNGGTIHSSPNDALAVMQHHFLAFKRS
jgi:hypothetical protein